MSTFNLAEAIMQVRAMEAKIEKMEDEFEAKMKPFEDFVAQQRTAIHAHLNATGQKSTQTPYGGAYWKPKITWRVEDKDAFRRHVIGSEQWELITWAAAGVACEMFTEEHKEPPPGLDRTAVNILYITAPVAPRKRKPKSNGVADPAGQAAG
jgi:hypothetical protein